MNECDGMNGTIKEQGINEQLNFFYRARRVICKVLTPSSLDYSPSTQRWRRRTNN